MKSIKQFQTLNLSKLYTAFFPRGSSGNFLLWLINQHDGFTKPSFPNFTMNNDKIIEFGFPYSSWNTEKENIVSFQKRIKHYLINNKIAIKQLPHNLDTKKIKITNYQHINTIIFYISQESDKQYVYKRKSSLLKGKETDYSIEFSQDHLFNIFKKTDYRFICLDIAKILKCDDVEYNKLLEFINCPALENWKVHIVDYKKALDIHI